MQIVFNSIHIFQCKHKTDSNSPTSKNQFCFVLKKKKKNQRDEIIIKRNNKIKMIKVFLMHQSMKNESLNLDHYH